MRSASRLPPGSRHRAVAVLSLALLLALLSACGKGSGDDPTRALSPAPTTAARASVLAATATAVAVQGPPGTPAFYPATQRAAVASAASSPIKPPSPTQPGLPREGTPRSIPGATGQLVSIGERRLWIACQGSGGPTVVTAPPRVSPSRCSS